MFQGKAILIMGPRQVGKSTLVQQILSESTLPTLMINGDDVDIRQEWQNTTTDKVKNVLGKTKILVIDEDQRIDNIGIIDTQNYIPFLQKV